MKYYLAGPMTGIKDYNYPLFTEVAGLLRGAGMTILSPHEIDYNEAPGEIGKLPYHTYIRGGLKLLLQCDGIIVLPGWRNSTGARIEMYVATACGFDRLKWENGQVLDLPEEEIANVR